MKTRGREAVIFEDLSKLKEIHLYAGDIYFQEKYVGFCGLSLTQSDSIHIKHDVRDRLPLNDNSILSYLSEDVFEHIDPQSLPNIINEIYRVLVPGGLFRLAVPDYRCDFMFNRCLKDDNGNIIFDPEGGGEYIDGRVVGGGHIWFPVYDSVKEILERSRFSEVNFLHYYNEVGEGITHNIDYSCGYIRRTPDHDSRGQKPYRPISLIVDCIK